MATDRPIRSRLVRLSRLLPVALAAAVAFGPLAAAPVSGQRLHASPQAAAEALLDAVLSGDRRELRPLFGVDTHRVAPIPDDETMGQIRDSFAAAWGRGQSIETLDADRARLVLGASKWSYPLPIVRTADGWVFDTRAGATEIVMRRMGRNESATIRVMHAYVDAQHEYAQVDRDGDGVAEYARRLTSQPGRRDGLYWPTRPGEPESPLGPLKAAAETAQRGSPYHGYRFRVLTAQGPSARGGERDYRVDGRLLRGFALIATPARYGASGVHTFIVSHHGRVHSADLGVHTDAIAARITRYDPGVGWKPEFD